MMAQWCERARHITETKKDYHSRADRAGKKVERDKARPVSRAQTPQWGEGPVIYLGLHPSPLKESVGRFLEVGDQ